ncbi:MAG: tetratricopeptide repeat protein [Nitrospirae bacterium]|nr:tetratricopeptide repeat protein [Nitrospirota bacterium]
MRIKEGRFLFDAVGPRFPLWGMGRLCLLLFFSGCAGWASLEEATAPAEHFKKAEAFFEGGKYAEAIKEYRYVVNRFPDGDLADHAQYNIAYTEIYFKNASADYEAAVRDFQQVVQKYPESPWKSRAQNWLNFLAQMESLKTEKEKLRSDLQRLLDLDMQAEKKRRELK